MTLPKPGKNDTELGRRERERSRSNRLDQPRPTKKENGGSPVMKQSGAVGAKANIMGRVVADHNRSPLVVESAENEAIWPRIVMLRGLFVLNARNRGTTSETARN